MNESLLVQWTIMTRLKTYLSFYRTYNTTCIQDDHRVNTEVEISEQTLDRLFIWRPLVERTTAEVADLRIGKRLVARCPLGGSDEKAAAPGRGRHLVACAEVQTFCSHIPMKTQLHVILPLLNFQ